MLCSCFAHVVNLAVQAIYAALKDGHGLGEQYLLGGSAYVDEATLRDLVLPEGVTVDSYLKALKADVLGVARKLIAACRASGRRREEFVDTIVKGNQNMSWPKVNGTYVPMDVLQLLRDCDTRWSSTYLMVDRALVMLPVCSIIIGIYFV